MQGKIKILGFAGSLRKESYSKAILREAKSLAPKDVEVEIFDLEGIPLFNQDLENPLPKIVSEFKKKIEEADGIFMVAPEQNFSISAALKNAIEWGSRPEGKNSFNDKPAALITVSTGMRGGARAEGHLRQICVDINLHTMSKPRVYVDNADKKIDEEGKLTDETMRERIGAFMAAFTDWIKRLSKK